MIASLLATMALLALFLVRQAGWDHEPLPPPVDATPASGASVATLRANPPAVVATLAPPTAEPPPQSAPPTHAAFDLATLARLGAPEDRSDEPRFETNAWFTEEDLRHPERYFERAREIPELSRPEERRRTLEYFLAYRAQLERELEEAEPGDERAVEIRATLRRYDDAIVRLRAIIDAEQAGRNQAPHSR